MRVGSGLDWFLDQSELWLLAEGGALDESGLAAGGLAQHRLAAGTHDHSLGVAEDGGDVEARGTLDVHEVRVGSRHYPLPLVPPLLQPRV